MNVVVSWHRCWEGRRPHPGFVLQMCCECSLACRFPTQDTLDFKCYVLKDRFRDPPVAVWSLSFCFTKTFKKTFILQQFQVPGERDRTAQRFPVALRAPARPHAQGAPPPSAPQSCCLLRLAKLHRRVVTAQAPRLPWALSRWCASRSSGHVCDGTSLPSCPHTE